MSIQDEKIIKRVVKFEYDGQKKEFGNVQTWPILCSYFGVDNKLLKAYRVDDRLYLLFLERELIYVDENFEVSKKTDWETLFGFKARN